MTTQQKEDVCLCPAKAIADKPGTPYRDLSWPQRRAIMVVLEQAGSALYEGHVKDGFTAAIGRGKLHATFAEMQEFGFVPRHTVSFPLGTDTPAEHLRHDGAISQKCNWLLCTFMSDPATAG